MLFGQGPAPIIGDLDDTFLVELRGRAGGDVLDAVSGPASLETLPIFTLAGISRLSSIRVLVSSEQIDYHLGEMDRRDVPASVLWMNGLFRKEWCGRLPLWQPFSVMPPRVTVPRVRPVPPAIRDVQNRLNIG